MRQPVPISFDFVLVCVLSSLCWNCPRDVVHRPLRGFKAAGRCRFKVGEPWTLDQPLDCRKSDMIVMIAVQKSDSGVGTLDPCQYIQSISST